MKLWGAYKLLESLPDTSLLYTNLSLETICQKSFSLFGRIRLSPQTSKTSESTASFPLNKQNDGQLQKFADK